MVVQSIKEDNAIKASMVKERTSGNAIVSLWLDIIEEISDLNKILRKE
jgi:hypothetical protein